LGKISVPKCNLGTRKISPLCALCASAVKIIHRRDAEGAEIKD
jgi:hypothetical protein